MLIFCSRLDDAYSSSIALKNSKQDWLQSHLIKFIDRIFCSVHSRIRNDHLPTFPSPTKNILIWDSLILNFAMFNLFDAAIFNWRRTKENSMVFGSEKTCFPKIQEKPRKSRENQPKTGIRDASENIGISFNFPIFSSPMWVLVIIEQFSRACSLSVAKLLLQPRISLRMKSLICLKKRLRVVSTNESFFPSLYRAPSIEDKMLSREKLTKNEALIFFSKNSFLSSFKQKSSQFQRSFFLIVTLTIFHVIFKHCVYILFSLLTFFSAD